MKNLTLNKFVKNVISCSTAGVLSATAMFSLGTSDIFATGTIPFIQALNNFIQAETRRETAQAGAGSVAESVAAHEALNQARMALNNNLEELRAVLKYLPPADKSEITNRFETLWTSEEKIRNQIEELKVSLPEAETDVALAETDAERAKAQENYNKIKSDIAQKKTALSAVRQQIIAFLEPKNELVATGGIIREGESVGFDKEMTNSETQNNIASSSVNILKVSDSSLASNVKEMFKDTDAVLVDFASKQVYGSVLETKCDLGKDKANQELIVYYIYNNGSIGKDVRVFDNIKATNEGTITIKANHGASYIVEKKTETAMGRTSGVTDLLKASN